MMSLSARRGWIEIGSADYVEYNYNKSLSARRAWIEIGKSTTLTRIAYVALRKESVDRNPACYSSGHRQARVALRKESVDRNTNPGSTTLTFPGVALRKESVDRNCDLEPIRNNEAVSLSARRAWIEIRFFARIA